MDLDGSAWWVPTLVVSSPTLEAPSSTSAWKPSTFSSSKELLLPLLLRSLDPPSLATLAAAG